MARPVAPTWPMTSPRFTLAPFLTLKLRKVAVAGFETEAVIDDDQVAVGALVAGLRTRPEAVA